MFHGLLAGHLAMLRSGRVTVRGVADPMRLDVAGAYAIDSAELRNSENYEPQRRSTYIFTVVFEGLGRT